MSRPITIALACAVPYLFSMSVETLGEAWQLGWRVTTRCAYGTREGLKSVRDCHFAYDLDMNTLVWTRGKNFPLALLASRLKCPRCGSSRVSLIFHVPKEPNSATAAEWTTSGLSKTA